jgi:hypothetical protein
MMLQCELGADLDIFAEHYIGNLVVCSGPARQVNHEQPVYALAILIKDQHIREISVGGILDDLLY